MEHIYLDNAATTPLSTGVIEAMNESMVNISGNPSSIHAFGRNAKAKLEMARKNIARSINANPAEIFFTSGGTEADNLALQSAANNLDLERIITSRIEHHAVLNTIEYLETKKKISVEYVDLEKDGTINLDHLNNLLNSGEKTLVSLMHVNNETGTLLNIKDVARACKNNGAFFHSDTVQSIAYFPIDVKDLDIDFITCSAHKFHGPKGVGFLYAKQGLGLKPIMHGGTQERGLRAGTENIHSIIGLEKALLDATEERDTNRAYLQNLKDKFFTFLEASKLEYSINGTNNNSSPAILNISLKMDKDRSMILFNMDLEGISISGGSACTSGSNQGSHVLKAMNVSMEQPAIRFSFSKMNTLQEIEKAVVVLEKLINS